MTTRFKGKPVGKIPFANLDTKRIAIPRDNLLRRIAMLFVINITTGGVTAPVAKTDTILNIIKKARLELEGDENKFNIDGVKWFEVEKVEKSTAPEMDGVLPSTLSTTKDLYVLLNADFAVNRTDETDTRALLSAPALTSLDLAIDWGDANDLATTLNGMVINVANSYCEVEVTEVFDDVKPESLLNGSYLDIREGIGEILYDQAYSSYDDNALESAITPTKSVVLNHLLLTRDNAGARKNDRVKQIKVVDTQGDGKNFIQTSFLQAQRKAKSEYSLESLSPGIVYFDWVDFLGDGLPNPNPEHTLKFKFLTNAPAAGKDKIEVFTRYVATRATPK